MTGGGCTVKAVLCTDFGCSPHLCCLLWKARVNAVLSVGGAFQPAVMMLLLLLQRCVDHMLVSSGGGPFRYANIILVSHLLNYVSRIDAFLAT